MRTKMHRQGWKANMAMLAVVMAIVIMATVPTIHVQAQKIWPVQMDDVTMRQYYNAIVSDFRNGYNSNWSGPRNKTYLVNDTASCMNFYGQSDYVSLILNSVQTELAGMDYYLGDTSAVNGATRLKNMISSNNDTIYLHFAIFSTDNASHTIYTFNEPLTSIQFSTNQTGRVVSEDGASSYYVREFERDGSWHEYFVPMSEFATILAQSVGSSATTGTDMSAGDMIVSITTVGEAGNMLNLDAIFFCDEAMKRQMQPEEPVVEQPTGMCGDTVNWSLQNDTLYIFGTGAMWDYTANRPATYADYSEQIRTVIIGEGVRIIGSYAFAGFGAEVLNIQLPEGLVSIGENAFEGCYGLYYLTIPNTVQSIGNETFVSCGNLREMVLPELITEIPANMFSFCSKLTNVSIPQNVTKIGDNAFYMCSVLTSIVLPSSTIIINGGAFANCRKLEYIQCDAVTPPTLNDIEDNPPFNYVPDTIPVYVPAQSVSAYKAADGWKYFTNILSLGGDTTEVDPLSGMCGDSVTWSYDSTYKELSISGTGTMWDFETAIPAYAVYSQEIQSILVAEGITKIGAYAFSGCSGATAIILPSSLAAIGSGAFSNCGSVQYITCMAINPPTLGEKVFAGLPENTPLYVPDESMGVYDTTDGWSDFVVQSVNGGQGEVYSFQLGDEINGLLETQTGVLSVTGTGKMWDYSLEAPSALSEYSQMVRYVMVEPGVTGIGNYAFYQFNAVEEVMLPETLGSIGTMAFGLCSSMKMLVSMSVTPPVCTDNTVFSRVPSDIPVAVPAKSVNAYKSAECWSYFKNILPMDGDTIEETTITVMGVVITPGDSTGTEPVDILGDGTMVYDGSDNTLTVSGADWSVGDEEGAAITYTGEEPLTIVLNDSSTILADTVIASTADIVITGEGKLVAEGTVPIIGTPTATITFDSVNMHVRSVPSAQALRHRIKSGKRLDETGGPALSGFGSADFNKTNVTPSDASYGPVTTTDENGEETTTNALYTTNEDGEQEVVTEFELTAQSDKTGVVNTRTQNGLDKDKPMYNVLGVQVGADYHGVVIQNGEKYLLK